MEMNLQGTSIEASVETVKSHFEQYLQYAIDHGEVKILHDGKCVARIISEDNAEGILAATHPSNKNQNSK